MSIYGKTREGRISRAFVYELTGQRAHPTTTAVKINPICHAWRCNDPARAAVVDHLGGDQRRYCRRHWLAAQQFERVDHVRRQLARLFGNLWPLGEIRGALEVAYV